MPENNTMPFDTEIETLKKSILKDVDALMENLIDQTIGWAKTSAQEAKADNENVEELKHRGNSFGVPTAVEINSIIRDCVGKCIEIGIKEGVEEYDETIKRAEEKAYKKTFFNIMTRCLKKQKDKEDGVNDGIQMCQDILPDWDKNKIQSELMAMQKDLKLDLNISDIFLNLDVMEKIQNKDLRGAYILFSKNETVNDEEKPLEFMKKVVKTLGIDDDILDEVIKAVEEFEGGDDLYFAQKLKEATLKTDEYKKIFNSNGE